jgi:hypothetical protein
MTAESNRHGFLTAPTREKGSYRVLCRVKKAMPDPFVAARKRQLARLGGAKPPAPRAAMALAKSQAYQDAADAPTTLRAYAADLANYKAWCERHDFDPMPATRKWSAHIWRQPGKATPFRHSVAVSPR